MAVAVYLPVVQGEILGWDDAEIISDNYRIKYLSAETVIDIFRPVSRYGHTPFALYVPLTELTVALEYQLVGEAPWLYHITNVLLHMLNTLLVALFVWRLFGDRTTALLTGALFAVHPLHVESVAWISERKDVLCVFFYLLTLLAHLRWQRQGRWSAYVLVQVYGSLALLAKPLAMTLPLTLLLCDVYTKRLLWQTGRPLWRRRLPFQSVYIHVGVVLEKVPLTVAAAWVAFFNVYQQHAYGALVVRQARSVLVNVLMACHGVCLYVIKTVLPLRLSPVYPQPQELYLTDGITMLAVVVTCSVTLLALLAWRRWRALAFALAFFCITLVPNSQLVPTGLNIYAADRFYYLPGIGLLYVLARAMRRGLTLRRGRGLLAAAIAIVLACLAWRTWSYATVWHSDQSLWEYTLRLLPEFRVAKGNLALAYQKRGERERAMAMYHDIIAREHDPIATANLAMEYYKAGDATQALHYAALSLQGRTNLYQGLFVRAAARAALGNVTDAIADLQRVLQLKPLFTEPYLHLAYLQQRINHTNDSIATLERYLSLEHDDSTVAMNVAGLYEHQHNWAQARAWYRRVAQATGNHVAWYRCGLLSLKLGEFAAARAALERAVSIAPDYIVAWVDLAVAHRELGNHTKALELSAHAIARAPHSAKAWYDRACILVSAGACDDAISALQQALARAPELRASAARDPDFAVLKTNAVFQALLRE